MLLFSTTLSIEESFTKDMFIEAIIEWNQNSPHEENRIPGLEWKGEWNIRYGNDKLWLDITEYRNRNIVAVRYEKIEEDGVIWDTDYVMNFDEMKLAIQLDRSYKEEALVIDSKFSTPHFITMLINKNCLKSDNNLPLLKEPIWITEDNLEMLTEIINGNVKYRLPVVYVSKTVYNRDPVDVKWLASRLKGVAHVLVQSDKRLNGKCRTACADANEYNGSIGIYYPNSAVGHRRFSYRHYTGSDTILLDKVVRNVIQYSISQKVDNLFTWQGVSNALLSDRLYSQREERLAAEHAKKIAEDETQKVYDTFDEDLKVLQKKVEELTRNNDALRYENQGLRTKLNGMDAIPILYLGDEDEFYQSEIKVVERLQEFNRTTKTRLNENWI